MNEIVNALVIMKKLLSEETMEAFRECDCQTLCIYNNLSLGIWIREYLLTEESRLLALFRASGVSDLDEMSMIMIEWFYFYVNSKIN